MWTQAGLDMYMSSASLDVYHCDPTFFTAAWSTDSWAGTPILICICTVRQYQSAGQLVLLQALYVGLTLTFSPSKPSGTKFTTPGIVTFSVALCTA